MSANPSPMTKPSPQAVTSHAFDAPGSDLQQAALLETLHARYAGGSLRWRYWWKRYAFLAAVGGAKALKRAVDILGAGVGLVVFSPVMAAIAACIKLTDNGPIFYIAPRVGKWGREFPFPKFRSMVVDAERLKAKLAAQNDHGESVTFKMKRDPRVTWIGRIIRKTSLDELPQLWCVLIGEMSLVGPRPPIPAEVERYSLAERRRLDVTPGLTCIWQVRGRGDIPFDQQVLLDVEYIESQSLWLDLKLIAQTVPAVLLGKGAY